MRKYPAEQPFLKWAGGKRQLLPQINQYRPKRFHTYYEPFVGAGAVLFDLQPKKAVVNDLSGELINCYLVIRDSLPELLSDLLKHRNEKEYFYQVRDQDRSPSYQSLSAVARASRITFLNKTCYNGLFRYNSQGQFNAPFGHYKNPKIGDPGVFSAVNRYLEENDVAILNTDFEEALKGAIKGDFVYLDPPYDPLSDTSSFTGYDLHGFGKDEQRRLKDVYQQLTQRGCKVLLSNSATPFILDLYRGYRIITVPANRSINSVATGRGKIDELLVMNYG
jgi:DNA adenine methylase